MSIVRALGGVAFFNAYAGIAIAALVVIAICLVIIAIRGVS